MRYEKESPVKHDPCPLCGGDLLYVGDVELRIVSMFQCERCGIETLTLADPTRKAVLA